MNNLRLRLLEGAGKVIDLFRSLDRDGDGKVTRDEFRQALPLVGFDSSQTDVVDDLFRELDGDGNGTIEYEELTAALRHGLSVELDAELRDGAQGGVDDWGTNALRERKVHESQEREVLENGAGREVDNGVPANREPTSKPTATKPTEQKRPESSDGSLEALEEAPPPPPMLASTTAEAQAGRQAGSKAGGN